MQRNSFQEKKFLVKNPCREPETCSYEDDYDPCGSTDDITEKDLAVLLLEESRKKLQNGGEKVGGEEEGEEDGEATETEAGEEPSEKFNNEKEKDKKKKTCKIVIKNPFFTSPLNFSSNLPPPPPSPPTQLLPLTVTESMEKTCQKLKKKKPCQKSKGEETKPPPAIEKSKKDDGAPVIQPTAKVDLEESTEGAEGSRSQEYSLEDFEDVDCEDKGTEADVEDEADEINQVTNKGRERKKCRKRSERPPCRKKGSDISISLLPPQIPPLQKDLPLTSPKDIPEVEKQVLMACGACVKPDHKCKKHSEKAKAKRSS